MAHPASDSREHDVWSSDAAAAGRAGVHLSAEAAQLRCKPPNVVRSEGKESVSISGNKSAEERIYNLLNLFYLLLFFRVHISEGPPTLLALRHQGRILDVSVPSC